MAQGLSGGRPLPEQAAEHILQFIKEKELHVGDKLPNEFQLAEICEVGRSTIREAIKLLIFEGRVEVLRGSGTFITEPKPSADLALMEDDPIGLYEDEPENLAKRALEFFDVRLMLEPEVAALAAANATYSDCQQLLDIQREVEQCVESDQDHLQADIRFHTHIADCTHSKVIRNLTEIVVKGIPVFVEITRNSLKTYTLEQHRMITEAIVAGDAVGARCAMITHLNNNRKHILNVMAEQKA